MSLPISKSNDEAPILGISIAVLAIVVLVFSWRVSAFIELQNQNIRTNIQNMEQQSARGQQMDQTSLRLVQVFLNYVQQSKDANISRLITPYVPVLPVFGVQIQQAPAGQQPAAQAAPAPAKPATQPAR